MSSNFFSLLYYEVLLLLIEYFNYRISYIKALGAYFFYFRIASFINEQGLIRIITILPIHVPYHVQEFGNNK